MMLSPHVSLVNFVVDGIKFTLNRETAKDMKRKHPSAQISSLRKTVAPRINSKPSDVRIMSAAEYMKSM